MTVKEQLSWMIPDVKPFPSLVIKLVQFQALGQSNTHNPKIVARDGKTISKLHSGFWVNFTISKENCHECVTIAQQEAENGYEVVTRRLKWAVEILLKLSDSSFNQ